MDQMRQAPLVLEACEALFAVLVGDSNGAASIVVEITPDPDSMAYVCSLRSGSDKRSSRLYTDPSQDILSEIDFVEVADAWQDFLIENLRAAAPQCPAHPHPLRITPDSAEGERIWWACPVDHRIRRPLLDLGVWLNNSDPPSFQSDKRPTWLT